MLHTPVITRPLLLFTHPVVLGAGRPLFARSPKRSNSTSWNSVHFDQGVTMHRYVLRGAR
jgi:hypothetical protein